MRQNDRQVWLDWSYNKSSISRTSRNWIGTNWAVHEDRRQVRTPQAKQTNPECPLTAAQYCLQWGAPEKVIFIGRLEEKRGEMGAFPGGEWISRGEWCSQSLLSPSHTGYGPSHTQGENHQAVRIGVQIRYTVKTLGPLGTKLDSSKAMFRLIYLCRFLLLWTSTNNLLTIYIFISTSNV